MQGLPTNPALATLAKDHPFTFLDHALRHGDSLVGLSREQIACFNWEVEAQMPLLRSLTKACPPYTTAAPPICRFCKLPDGVDSTGLARNKSVNDVLPFEASASWSNGLPRRS